LPVASPVGLELATRLGVTEQHLMRAQWLAYPTSNRIGWTIFGAIGCAGSAAVGFPTWAVIWGAIALGFGLSLIVHFTQEPKPPGT
jgi:hypothetical protein